MSPNKECGFVIEHCFITVVHANMIDKGTFIILSNKEKNLLIS